MTMQAQLCQWHLGLDVVVEDSNVQMDNLDVVAAGSSMQVNHPGLDVVAAGSGGQQQLQEHTVIDEQPRNVVDELGAGEELPGVDINTFIVFEWVDYDGDRKKRVRSKSRNRKVKKFSLGRFKPVYWEVSTGLVAWSRKKAIHKRSWIQAQRIKNSKLGRKTCWRRTSSHSISACNRQVKVRCHPYKSHRPIKNTSKKI
eukprot:g61501.t1